MSEPHAHQSSHAPPSLRTTPSTADTDDAAFHVNDVRRCCRDSVSFLTNLPCKRPIHFHFAFPTPCFPGSEFANHGWEQSFLMCCLPLSKIVSSFLGICLTSVNSLLNLVGSGVQSRTHRILYVIRTFSSQLTSALIDSRIKSGLPTYSSSSYSPKKNSYSLFFFFFFEAWVLCWLLEPLKHPRAGFCTLAKHLGSYKKHCFHALQYSYSLFAEYKTHAMVVECLRVLLGKSEWWTIFYNTGVMGSPEAFSGHRNLTDNQNVQF